MDKSKQLALTITHEVHKVTRSQLIKGANAAAKAAVEAIQARTAAGISYKGQRLPKLTENYNERKKNKLSELIKGKQTTTFKAVGVPNHGRLTGQFFTDMFAKITSTKIGTKDSRFEITMQIKSRSAKKPSWLESATGATRGWFGRGKKKTYSKKPRYIFGLSEAGAWYTKERNMIRDAFIKAVGKYLGVKVT